MSLAAAVAQIPDQAAGAVALVYSALRCGFARLDGATLIDGNGSAMGDDAFEARVFNGDFELRWLQSRFDGGVRRGRAVLLHETPALGGEPRPDIIHTLERQYVLWGQADPPAASLAPEWSSLSTARIGTLAVPLANIPQSRRVILRAREYMAQEPEHGNAYIADERLLCLSVYTGEAANA
jgi:CRISPR-associated protein (TIGR03984 family)